MSEMEKATAMLQKSRKSKQPHERAIAAYLMEYIEKNPDQAGKLTEAGKSIEDLMKTVKENARKQAVSSCAVIESYEVFEWVREYYDLVGAEPDEVVPDRRETPPDGRTPKNKTRVLDINPDELF